MFTLLKGRPLVLFLVCAVMFHFANAAMLPLLGEMLAKGQGRKSMMFMSACVVTTQLVITLLASWAGRKAGSWGRKPLLYGEFSGFQLKIIQEVVTLIVFIVFALTFLKEKLAWNYLVAFVSLGVAAFFAFAFKATAPTG